MWLGVCPAQWICHVSARLWHSAAFKALAAKVTRNFVLFLGRIRTLSGQRMIGSFKVDRPRFTTTAWLRKLAGRLPRGVFEIQPRRLSVTPFTFTLAALGLVLMVERCWTVCTCIAMAIYH
jgi:hypothetical protein